MQHVYADGCFSHEYKTAGLGWVIANDFLPERESDQDVLFGSQSLVGVKSTLEIEFMAQYYSILAAQTILVRQQPIILHTDNCEIIQLLKNRILSSDILVGRNIYVLLDEYSSWDINLVSRRNNLFMNKCDILSRESMHELRDEIRPKNHKEKAKFKKKQHKLSKLT